MTNPDPNLPRNLSAESSAEVGAWVRNSLGPEQQSNNDNVTNDIAAELADHLAESTAAARVRGLNEEQAKAHAAGCFGDVAAILRQCWWIKKGDAIMFRSAAIILGCICVIGLFAVAYSTWQIEASFTDRMDTLSGELRQLNETQQRLLANLSRADVDHAEQQITGKLYLGDPSVPAVNAEVEIWNAKTQTMVRQVRTDSNGHYATGALSDGEYFVFAPLVGPGNSIIPYRTSGDRRPESRKRFYVQSEPMTVWPDGAPLSCDLDVQLQTGRVRLEFNRAVSPLVNESSRRPFKVGFEFSHLSYLQLPFLGTANASRSAWQTAETRTPIWPQRGVLEKYFGEVLPGEPEESNVSYGSRGRGASDSFLICDAYEFAISPEERFLPSGEYSVKTLIGPSFPNGNYIGDEARPLTDLERLSGAPTWNRRPIAFDQEAFEFVVRPNQVTRLQLVIPEGYESRVATALQNKETDTEAFVRECSLQPVMIELIGYEPL